MKQMIAKRLCCLILTISLCLGLGVPTLCTAADAESEDIIGTTAQNCTSYKITYHYNDDWLLQDSTVYNGRLAAMSMVMNMTAMSDDCALSTELLKALGYTDITPYKDKTASFLIAKKTVGSRVLVAAILQNSNSTDIWKNAAIVGTSGNASGMQSEADCVVARLNTYLDGLGTGSPVVWMTGYGVSGGIGDLAAKAVTDSLGAANVFGYFTEPLKAAAVSANGTYGNIHCICNNNDPMIMLMPTYMGFGYYGTVHTIADTNSTAYSGAETRMKKNLAEICSWSAKYDTPSDFTWAKIKLDISNISELTEGNYLSDVDENHTQGCSQAEFLSVLASRVQIKAIKNRSAYATEMPSDVSSAASNMGVSSPYTTQEAAGAAIGLLASIPQETLDAISENFGNFPFTSYLAKIKVLYTYLTDMRYGTLVWRNYKSLCAGLWDVLDTDEDDYNKISDYLDADQISEAKKLFPILLYRLGQYTSEDYDEDNQTIGALVNNIDSLTQAVKPELSMAWLMLEDHVYCKNFAEVTVKEASPATCTEAGYTAETVCSICGRTVSASQPTKPTGHTELVTKAASDATCTEEGCTEEISCAVCKKVLVESQTVKAKGHSFSQWQSANDLVHSHACACGETETREHTWVETETTAVSVLYTCTVCGGTKTESIVLPGDMNGDGEVNSDDAIYLLKHLFSEANYPIAAGLNRDCNGDGEVNSDDSIYLLKYLFSPNNYPLS